MRAMLRVVASAITPLFQRRSMLCCSATLLLNIFTLAHTLRIIFIAEQLPCWRCLMLLRATFMLDTLRLPLAALIIDAIGIYTPPR